MQHATRWNSDTRIRTSRRLPCLLLLVLAACQGPSGDEARAQAEQADRTAEAASRRAEQQRADKAPAPMVPGTLAPEFVLTDDRGNVVRSSDFAGQRYLLWFYPKAGTPG